MFYHSIIQGLDFFNLVKYPSGKFLGEKETQLKSQYVILLCGMKFFQAVILQIRIFFCLLLELHLISVIVKDWFFLLDVHFLQFSEVMFY